MHLKLTFLTSEDIKLLLVAKKKKQDSNLFFENNCEGIGISKLLSQLKNIAKFI